MAYMVQKNNRGSPTGDQNGVGYSHRQVGKVQVWASIIAVIIISITAFFVPEMLFLFGIATLALGFGLLLFATLTVEITGREIKTSFGPVPAIKKTIPFDQITTFSLVTNPWYYGWGIRWIPKGTMYNIAGYDAADLRLITGKCFRIGTDDPQGLVRALEKATGLQASVS